MAEINGTTVEEASEYYCEKIEAILDKYKVSDADKETITDAVKEAYYQLSEAYRFMRKWEELEADDEQNA